MRCSVFAVTVLLFFHHTRTPRGSYFTGFVPAVSAVQYYVTVGCSVVPEGRVMFPPGIAENPAEKRRNDYAPFLLSHKKQTTVWVLTCYNNTLSHSLRDTLCNLPFIFFSN
jgi:hypothetical protein